MPGGGTDNAAYAVVDATTKQPVQNGARQIWVTETALTTALNTSYMADRLGLFGIVVGIALLLSGFGFGILAVGGALRNPQTALSLLRRTRTKAPAVPVA
jgi:F0F1-type ATP synthase membrane subunit c/vacuolar-type H+-ATPase subunit K